MNLGVVVSLGKIGKSLGNSSLVLSVIELVDGTSEVEEIVVEVVEAVVVEVLAVRVERHELALKVEIFIIELNVAEIEE